MATVFARGVSSLPNENANTQKYRAHRKLLQNIFMISLYCIITIIIICIKHLAKCVAVAVYSQIISFMMFFVLFVLTINMYYSAFEMTWSAKLKICEFLTICLRENLYNLKKFFILMCIIIGSIREYMCIYSEYPKYLIIWEYILRVL